MAIETIRQSYPHFTNGDGEELNSGYIYIGEDGKDPESNPITVYWDAEETQPAAQPLRTVNGFIARSGTPSRVWVSTDYSITVRDKKKNVVWTSLENNSELNINSFPISFSTVSEMRASEIDFDDGQVVILLGNVEAGDGGGGIFYWDGSSLDDENGAGTGPSKASGTVVKLTDTFMGRFLRDYEGGIYIEWFGGKVDDDTVNSSPALQAALDIVPNGPDSYAPGKPFGGAGQVEVIPLDGTYTLDDPIDCSQRSYVQIRASGRTIFEASHDSYVFDMTSIAYSHFEGFRIESDTASIGIYINRATTNAFALFNKFKNVSIELQPDATANGGVGKIALYNNRGEQDFFENLELRADVPYWATQTWSSTLLPLFSTQNTSIQSSSVCYHEQSNFIKNSNHSYSVILDGCISFDFKNCYWSTTGPSGGNVYAVKMNGCNRCSFTGSVETVNRFAHLALENYCNNIDIAYQVLALDSEGVINLDSPGTVGYLDGDVRVLVAGAAPPSGACIFRDSGVATTVNIRGVHIQTTALMQFARLTGTRNYTKVIEQHGTVLRLLEPHLKMGQTTSSDPNTFDYYQEGTFTPDVVGSTSAGSPGSGLFFGYYTRIGRQVFVTMTLAWTSHSGSGNMLVTGLPFTSSNLANSASQLTIRANNIPLTANYYPLGSVQINSTQITLEQLPTGGGGAIAIPLFTSGSLAITGSYISA